MVALRSPNSSTLPTNDARMLIPAVALNDHATLLRSCPSRASSLPGVALSSQLWLLVDFLAAHQLAG